MDIAKALPCGGGVKTRKAGSLGWLEGYRRGESLTHLTAFGKLKAGWGVYSGRDALLRTRGDGSTELTDHMDTPAFSLHMWGWLHICHIHVMVAHMLVPLYSWCHLSFTYFLALVVQRIEQPPSKRRVAGSNPA